MGNVALLLTSRTASDQPSAPCVPFLGAMRHEAIALHHVLVKLCLEPTAQHHGPATLYHDPTSWQGQGLHGHAK